MDETKAYRPENDRERILRLSAWMKNDRAPYESHWRQLGDNIFPRRTRFYEQDRNRSGPDRFGTIVNERGLLAARTLRSGMMSGITSPARPWRRITTSDPDLSEHGPVKQWLFQTNKILTAFNSRSNFYKVVPTLYGDLGVFGTGAVGCFPDDKAPFRRQHGLQRRPARDRGREFGLLRGQRQSCF